MKAYLKPVLAAAFLMLCCVVQAQTLYASTIKPNTNTSVQPVSPSAVLVVGNAANAQSVSLVDYYGKARNIPAQNKLLLNLPAQYTPDNADTISLADYQKYIAAPIYSKIKTLPHIDYIVLCRNLPIKIYVDSNRGYDDQSVDSCLAGGTTLIRSNPYAYSTAVFNSTKYGMYLVTRLDGWSWSDAFALVDNSLRAKAAGLFFFDEQPDLNPLGYAYDNSTIATAYTNMVKLKAPACLDATSKFCSPGQALGGYVSFGSDDDRFSPAVYQALTFVPGAIVETLVSTSAINLRYPQPGESNGGAIFNQSQIAQLIHNGATGIVGYVAEPYCTSDPSRIFPAYFSGMNLAEAFYAGAFNLGWKDIVVGDPLCCPYAR